MNDVISAIYHAAAGTRSWATVLTKITQDLGLLGCQMVGVSASQGAVLFSYASDDAPSDIEIEYVRNYHARDPRLPLVLGSKDGVWVFDQDAFGPRTLTEDPYYRDLLIPYGGQFSATSKLTTQGDRLVLLGCMSKAGDPGFGNDRRQYLHAIADHLREGAGIYLRTRQIASAAVVGAELLRRMPRPALLLSEDRRVTFKNALADAYLAEAKTLFMSGDRLTAYDSQTDIELETAFRAMGATPAQGAIPLRRIVRTVSRFGGRGAVLALTAFVPDTSMFAFGSQPQVLMIMHDQGLNAVPDVLLWEAAFDLTPAQSRVALELFRGRTIAEAAVALNICPSTLKTHLKDLFKKTGTSRQSQLMSVFSSMR